VPDSLFVPVEMHSFEPGAAANGADEEDVDVDGGAAGVPDAIAAVLQQQQMLQESSRER
jgi:hypothetical protein